MIKAAGTNLNIKNVPLLITGRLSVCAVLKIIFFSVLWVVVVVMVLNP